MIVRYFHESVGHHQGRGVTKNEIRQAGYWIVDGRSTVARTISKCVTCRQFRGQLQTQKMSDLPEERVTQAAPFHYAGMAVHGPFYVKEGSRKSMLQEHGSRLDDEALHTLMTAAENVINSRPLTVENLSDHKSPEPLTPNHLLTSKTEVVLPPAGCFERLDL